MVPFKRWSKPRFTKKEWRLANDTVNTIIETDWYGKPNNHSCSRGLCWKGTFPSGKSWPFPFSLTLNNSTYFDVVSSSIELHQNALINEICQRAIFWTAEHIFICGYLLQRATTRVVLHEILCSTVLQFKKKYDCTIKKINLGSIFFHSFDLILIWKCQRIKWILICMKAIIYNWWI